MKQDWANDKLCDIVLIGDGNHSSNYPKKSEMVTEGIPFIRATNIINGKITKDDMRYITKEKHENLKKGHLLTGDILFSNRGQIGKMAIVNKSLNNSNLNSQLAWFRCLESINNQFLYYQLLSPIQFNKIMNQQSGTALQQVTIRQLKNIEVSYPSLTEQKRIVAKLDDCFAAIDKARANVEKNLNNAKELFQSQLNEIFSQKGDGWVDKILDEIGEIQTGTTPSTKDKSNYGDFIPFVKPPHFKPDGSIDAGNSMLSESGLKIGRLFPPNSVLMVCIGATIGKTGFTETAVSSNQQINCLTPNENYYPKLLYYGLISPFVQKQVADIGRGAQATLPIINKTKWQGLSINIPESKSEQNKIVKQLDDLKSQTQSLESNYQQELDALEELKKSVLQKAFNGEL
ncbi:MAG: hypothetical protein HN674_09675 [Candidatus Marinimicrobia bacterium]|nr:hypothetical protein [Candidatus Neomarinimicrobiota bacterium]